MYENEEIFSDFSPSAKHDSRGNSNNSYFIFLCLKRDSCGNTKSNNFVFYHLNSTVVEALDALFIKINVRVMKVM